MTRPIKSLIIVAGSIIIIVVVLVLIISPVTKYYIRKNDEKLTGRKITMDKVSVNLFTGNVHISNLKVYEYKSDSVFISVAEITAKLNLWKLLSRTLKISTITFNQPTVKIIKRKNDFNFNDFQKSFRLRDSIAGPPLKTKKPFHFYFLSVKIEEGHFYFVDEVVPVHFSIKNVDIESTNGWRWDKDTISANVSFLSEPGTGGMKGIYGMNLKSLKYTMDVVVNTFDLNVIEQYLRPIVNFGSFRANFDADIKTTGSFKEAQDINIEGKLAINDLHTGKDPAEDYASFRKMLFVMENVNPKQKIYYFDSVLLFQPYFMYERFYKNSDNIQKMFGPSASKASAVLSDESEFNLIFSIGRYIKKLGQDFLWSDFDINRLAIYNGAAKFEDYSLSEKFTLEINPLTIISDSVDKKLNRVKATLESGIKPYGDLSVFLSINPKDTGDFDLTYHFRNVPVSIFNPYLITYTSFPLDRGTLELKGNWAVRNSEIQSMNHLVIVDPRLTNRIKNENDKWLPMPLIMSLIREPGNMIDYEMPITGNLKDPKLHISDVIFSLIGNIFIKPVTAPFRFKVKNAGNEIEKSLSLKWNMRQGFPLPHQEKFIKEMADFLAKNPEAVIKVSPIQYELKEKEYILFFEAKKAFYMMNHHINDQSFSKEDSLKVDEMSIRDSLFVGYINRQVKDSMLFTLQEQCAVLIDSVIVNTEFERLTKERKTAFMSYFKEGGFRKKSHIFSRRKHNPLQWFFILQNTIQRRNPAIFNQGIR